MPIQRKLSRKSSHRIAMLRNMVTSLFQHERIQTTWHKAKEAQKIADKLVTLGKKNTEASRRRAWSIFYTPHLVVPKLFSEIAPRYASRPGGYTRVLRIEPLKDDQAPSAILELVDSPKDTRFTHTALTLARMRQENSPMNELTSLNVAKVTRFRPDGVEKLERLVERFEEWGLKDQKGREGETSNAVDVILRGEEPQKVKAGVARQVRLGKRIAKDNSPGAYLKQRDKDEKELEEMGGAEYYGGTHMAPRVFRPRN